MKSELLLLTRVAAMWAGCSLHFMLKFMNKRRKVWTANQELLVYFSCSLLKSWCVFETRLCAVFHQSMSPLRSVKVPFDKTWVPLCHRKLVACERIRNSLSGNSFYSWSCFFSVCMWFSHTLQISRIQLRIHDSHSMTTGHLLYPVTLNIHLVS